jgi:hypothetical protein
MIKSTRSGDPAHRAPRAILSAVTALTLLAGLAPGAGRNAAPRTSRAYTITVSFDLTSPFVPDGRSSIAELEFRVVFAPVVFEFDPAGDPLLGRCQLETGRVEGVFSKFVLNDTQKGEERRTPTFLTPRPVGFLAGLGIESEPMEESDSAGAARVPPASIRLSFWTDFGPGPIRWGTTLGTGSLENFKTVFEAPFADLMAGRSRVITIPYEGKYPEDKGTWRIEFVPGRKK